jgi:hypothetical protein
MKLTAWDAIRINRLQQQMSTAGRRVTASVHARRHSTKPVASLPRAGRRTEHLTALEDSGQTQRCHGVCVVHERAWSIP